MVLKKLFGGSKLKNPEKVPEAFIDALTKNLAGLDNVKSGLTAKAVQFVVDDASAEFLLALAADDAAQHAIGNANGNYWSLSKSVRKVYEAAPKLRVTLFNNGGGVHSSVWLRVAMLFEAIGRSGRQPDLAPKSWPDWLGPFLAELLYAAESLYGRRPIKDVNISANTIEAMLTLDGQPPDLLARGALIVDSDVSTYGGLSPLLAGGYNDQLSGNIRDVAAYIARHPQVVSEALQQRDASARISAIERLKELRHDFTPQAELLVALAVGSAKTVAGAARPIIEKQKDVMRPLIEQQLREGNAQERDHAAGLLWRVFQHDVADLLREHAETERSARVKKTIEKALADESEAATAETQAEVEVFVADLPPLNVETGEVPLPEEVKTKLRAAIDEGNAALQKSYQQQMEHYEKQLEEHKAAKKRGEPTYSPYKPGKPTN